MAARPAQTSLGRLAESPLRGALRAAKRANRLTYRTPWPLVPDRLELAELLNRRRLLGCAVEVGVKQGEFSEALLSRWRGRQLISVDPWAAAPAEAYVDVANVDQATHDAFHVQAVRRLARFGARSSVWRTTGAQAAGRLPDGCLDLVYLDARHDRASVEEDLATWAPKVRPGGVLAGHDYLDGDLPEGEFGVRSAVDAFAAERGLRVGATFADPPWPSWFLLLAPGG